MEGEHGGHNGGHGHGRVEHVVPHAKTRARESGRRADEEVEPVQGQTKLKRPVHVPLEGTRDSRRTHEQAGSRRTGERSAGGVAPYLWHMGRFAIALALMIGGCAAKADSPTEAPAAAAGETVWASWSAEAFARAQSDNRIILINVVASWCHWCHVMDEETYANPEVAALLTEHFVTVRVDSDARPDVAERYRAWGWPATAVLTPSGQRVLELRGYQEPEAFADLLRDLIAQRDAGSLKRRPRKAKVATIPSELDAQRLDAIAQLDHYYEASAGGWGTMQKYPFSEPLEHALWRERMHGESQWRVRAVKTLAGQARLVDPIWGGMYQYSLEGDWDHPHYEKITAIQAGALASFSIGARATGDAKWLEPAQAVRGYMNAFMRDAKGGYATSQDADARTEYGEPVPGIEYYAMPDESRRAIGLPRIDTNVYADLNGLMIRGLVELSIAADDPEALEDAVTAAERLLRTHRDAEGLFRHGADDPDGGLRYLRDQAAVLWGLMALHRATSDEVWLAHATSLANAMLGALQDSDTGGLFAHTPDPAAIGVLAERRMPVEENALAGRALLRLHRTAHGEDTPYLEAARRALVAVAPARPDEGRIIGTYVLALEELVLPTVDITVVGPDADPASDALHRAALAYPEPRAHVERSLPGERYPDIGKPAVYLCTANSCSAPLKDVATFTDKADAVLKLSLPPSP